MRTLSSLLVNSLQTNLKSNLLGKKINGNWQWTSRETLLKNVFYCQELLKSENINQGDRVAYKGENSVEWLSWNIACNSLGAIWVPMYANQNMEYCNHVISNHI